MHEVSLVGSMLEIVREYSARHRFRKVNSLKLSFGALSCIDGSALQMAFDVLSKDTPASDASLEYTIHPIRILCLSCEQENRVDEFPSPCPACKGEEVSLVGGFEDLKLEELDVD